MTNNTLIVKSPVGAIAAGDGASATNILQTSYKGFAPEMLHTPIALILEQFGQGNKKAAKAQLQILRQMGNQDPKVNPAIEVVSVYLDMLNQKESKETKKCLIDYLKSYGVDHSSDLFQDLCYAALIRLAVREKNTSDARSIWESIEHAGSHTKNTFVMFVATETELKAHVQTATKPLLNEADLKSIVEGAIRVGNLDLAHEIFFDLSSLGDSPLVQFIQFILDVERINPELIGKHPWNLTATAYYEIIRLANKAAALLVLEPLPDQRLPLMGASILMYLNGMPNQLELACWEHISLIEKEQEEWGRILRYHQSGSNEGLNEFQKAKYKAEKDADFKSNHLMELLALETVNPDEAMFLIRFSKASLLSKWLSEGGICKEGSPLGSDLFTLYLLSYAVEGDPDSNEADELRSKCVSFLKNYKEDLKSLNPEIINEVASRLSYLQLPSEASMLISPLLPDDDLWLSPLVRSYMDVLFKAEQWKSLHDLLNNMKVEYWDATTFYYKAILARQSGDLPEAKTAIEAAILKSPTAQIYHGLVLVLQEMKRDDEIPEVLARIPDNLLQPDNKYACNLVYEMFNFGFEERAGKVLLGWFIDNPEKNAKSLCNLFLNFVIEDVPTDISSVKDFADMFGVQYNDGKQSICKLIVPQDKAHGLHMISSDSPLGQSLLNLEVGESVKDGVKSYQLEEKPPVLVAIFRISSVIRNSMNQGNDAFYILEVNKDKPEEILKQMQDVLSIGTGDQNNILEHELLPIMYKGHMTNRNDPFKAAIGLLSDAKVLKHPLPNFDSASQIGAIFLDVYAFAYLSLSGLAVGVTNSELKLYMSNETQSCILGWLEGRQKNSGMMIPMSNEQLVYSGGDEWRLKTKNIADQIQVLLANSEILYFDSVDMPSEFIRLKRGLCESVSSTLKLSLQHQIPWFCIDLHMAQVLVGIGIPVVHDAMNLMIRTSNFTPFENKKSGLYRHVFEEFPFPVLIQDFIDLSQDKTAISIDTLSLLLRQYPQAFGDVDKSATMMTSFFLSAFMNEWAENDLVGLDPSHDARFPRHVIKLANACFFHMLQCSNEKTAEYKMALVLTKLFEKLASFNMPKTNFKQFVYPIGRLATDFLAGHFLNVEIVNKHMDKLQGLAK